MIRYEKREEKQQEGDKENDDKRAQEFKDKEDGKNLHNWLKVSFFSKNHENQDVRRIVNYLSALACLNKDKKIFITSGERNWKFKNPTITTSVNEKGEEKYETKTIKFTVSIPQNGDSHQMIACLIIPNLEDNKKIIKQEGSNTALDQSSSLLTLQLQKSQVKTDKDYYEVSINVKKMVRLLDKDKIIESKLKEESSSLAEKYESELQARYAKEAFEREQTGDIFNFRK